MNLNAIVGGVIASVNPMTPATLLQSTGSTTNPDGTRTPTYAEIGLLIQVQALSSDELRQVDGLNIQGNKKAVYLNGRWRGIVRVGQQGGDLLKFYGQTWLAVTVLEDWATWTKLAVVEQMDGR